MTKMKYMVTKMEKFTSLQYDNLIKEINKIYENNTLINDIKVLPEAGVIDQLRSWFEINSYDAVKDLINSNEGLSETFLNIFRTVININNLVLNNQRLRVYLKKLKLYYNALELAMKNKNTKDSLEKETDDILINNYSKADSINADLDKLEKNIIAFKNKLNEYNDIDKKYKDNIDLFEKHLNSYTEKICKKTNENVENYTEILNEKLSLLKNNCENLEIRIKNIANILENLDNDVNREQLAHYFCNERKKLKGDIDIPVLIYTVLFEIFIFFITDTFTEFWHDFTLLKLIIFLVGIFIVILPFVKWGYYKFFEPETKNDVKPFDEIKAILTPYWCWLSLTFLGMFSIFTMAEEFYTKNMLEILQVKPFLFLANLPFFMILVWFTWFCSKQFSYTKQICDEYEYKYALSKSYLSYRDEAKNISLKDEDKGKYEAVIVSLLDSVIKNIATSPVKSVKPDCHTPFTEVFGSLKDVMKHTENKE